MSQTASTSLIPTDVLSAEAQTVIKQHQAEFVRFGQFFDAQNFSYEDKKALGTLSGEQWQQITQKLQDLPAFQAQMTAYKQGKTLEPLHGPAQDQLQVILGSCGVASSVALGVVGGFFGVAAALASMAAPAALSVVGAPIALLLGIAAAIIGVLGGIVAGVLGLIALLQPMESTLEVGGRGGSVFNDSPKEGWRLKRIVIHHGNVVDGIQCVWQCPDGSFVTGKHHGGLGGRKSVIELQEGEYVTEVSGTEGNVVDSLCITTNHNKYGPYGGNGGKSFSLQPRGGIVTGFYGRSGNLLDAIGIQDALYTYERIYFGGGDGIPLIDDMSDMKQLKRILVRSGSLIDTLQFEWINGQNEYMTGPEYGGYGIKGGELHTMELQNGEYLTKITGRAGIYLDGVQFHTNLRSFAPLGGSGGTPFEINLAGKQLLCFIGRYGRFIDGIGVLAKTL